MVEQYFDWTDLPFSADEFAQRRQQLYRELAPTGGVLLIPSGYHFSDGFTYRQQDDFYYFCGLELPNSVLSLDASRGMATLFVPEWDPRFDSPGRPNDFPGRRLASDPELSARSGIPVRNFGEFGSYLTELSDARRVIWLNGGRQGWDRPTAHPFFQPLAPITIFGQQIEREHPDLEIRDAYMTMARLRMVKRPAEIAVMRQACDIAMAGIRVSAAAIKPGITERQLEGILEAEFKRHGAQRLPFASIIKSGPNTLWPWRILASHYNRRNRPVQPGELVVYDVGCELHQYGSDMGRTFPADGTFSARHRDILSMQLHVLDSMIGAMRPGVTLAQVQTQGEKVIPARAQKYMSVKPFFGHHIGLSMGDPSLIEAPLQPGMIITVEPWYYNHDEGIGTFIEDVVLITESGCENLTASLPRTPDGMAGLTH